MFTSFVLTPWCRGRPKKSIWRRFVQKFRILQNNLKWSGRSGQIRLRL